MVETDFEWGRRGLLERRRRPRARGRRRQRDRRAESSRRNRENSSSSLLRPQPCRSACLGLEISSSSTPRDATLVCPKNRADDLKKLVEEIRAKGSTGICDHPAVDLGTKTDRIRDVRSPGKDGPGLPTLTDVTPVDVPPSPSPGRRGCGEGGRRAAPQYGWHAWDRRAQPTCWSSST